MTVEQSFLRYREHGDVPALGAVFDAVAQELALVAAHLAPPGVEPEDLVQATFVAAIEHSHRWDRARALTPWLIGILANQARRERQRERRGPPTPTFPATAPGPLDVVELQEIGTRIAEALRGLPRHYRQALTLRLLHGLQPAQIATALGCPIATCKTRLQRGLEMLRRALPAGISTSIAMFLVASKGLASCREAVLTKATAAAVAASAASATVLTGVLMKKTLTAVGVFALLATAIALCLPDSTAPRQQTPVARGTAQVVAAPPTINPADPEPVRAAVSNDSKPRGRADELSTIHGRVLDVAGLALPGVLVALGRTSPDGEFANVGMFLLYRALNPGSRPRLPADRLAQSDVAAVRTPDGHTLIVEQVGNVFELDANGEVVWHIEQLGTPMRAQRLTNGNTLVAAHKDNAVLEFGLDTKAAAAPIQLPQGVAAHRRAGRLGRVAVHGCLAIGALCGRVVGSL